MSEQFDITIWRLVGSYENFNHIREELIDQAAGGEYLGLRIATRNTRTVAYGWTFRFVEHWPAEAFEENIESHELPPEDDSAPIERAPQDDDDVELVRPNGEVAVVKRKRIENLLKKGWTVPGEEPSTPVEKPKKKQKQKQEKNAPTPVKIKEPFIATPDDWVVMMSPRTGDFIRVKRNRMDYMRSVGWKEGWDFYRAKYQELEKAKADLKQEMADIKTSIVALENKEDTSE